MNLIDIGANLAHSQFKRDLRQVLQEAKIAGVEHILVTGTSLDSSEQAIELCEAEPDFLSCTAGIHPHEAKDWQADSVSLLKTLLQADCVKAVGETGLDFNRNYSPHPQQEKAFEMQLALAVEQKLPVFLHERDAFDHFHAILKDFRDQLPNVVVHCFTGQQNQLFAYLDLDCHIGITGWICDERRGQHLKTLLPNIPLNRLMIETDAPYLLPRDLPELPKNRRNEPKFLPHIAQTIAQCYGIKLEEIAQATGNNARAFFGL